jgi:abortive infection bacteriophage resistance protein
MASLAQRCWPVAGLDRPPNELYESNNTPTTPLARKGHAPQVGFFFEPTNVAKAYSKPALTFEAQLALVQSRGLGVLNHASALSALERISYYRLSAYWFPFKKSDDTFEVGATFEGALAFYEYDRRLRLLLLDAIERIEIAFRNVVTYTLAHRYGPFAHADAKNFRPAPKFDHAAWYGKGLVPDVERSRETFLRHFQTTYDGFPRVPIWMASEVMSLGVLSKLFKGMQSVDQQAVADRWKIHHSVAESWVHVITVIRNICAHHGRLWNRELGVHPILPKHDVAWAGVMNKRRIYAVLCILRQLTQDHHAGDDWAAAAVAWLNEMNGWPRWQTSMGVPVGWASHKFWSGIVTKAQGR